MDKYHQNAASDYQYEDFNQKRLNNCDLVMKGGITSGVVYPYAICELAKKYRFKSVGGTSAGAIAAAATAAAEFGRTSKQPRAGFVGLSQVSQELEVNLQSLFQPWREATPLYNAFLVVLDQTSLLKKLSAFLLRVIPTYWISFSIGALPGFILLGIILYFGNATAAIIGGLCAAFIALIGGVAGVLYQLFKTATQGVDKFFYGICPGSTQSGYRQPGLTDWLTDLFDRLADKDSSLKSSNYQPLTFGDLWGAETEQAAEISGKRQINLEMMTTNLTQGIPHRLPTNIQGFAFDPEEFSKLFPRKIVQWLIERSLGKIPNPHNPESKLYRLPKPADIPVVVATRMSLSFPILLTAIPLYSIDGSGAATKCWFSDGGICSNFPIHFFDDLWPSWPTFAISLDRLNPNYNTEVWLPQDPLRHLMPPLAAFDSIPAFLGAIFDTAQNWKDTTQAMLPAYRDRIVHIQLQDDEGGLRLNMPAEIIQRLVARGKLAGQTLANNFQWESHRWLRYLSSTAQLEEKLAVLQKAYENIPPEDLNFKEFLQKYNFEEFLRSLPQSPEVQEYLASLEQAIEDGWLGKARNKGSSLIDFHQGWKQPPLKYDGLIPRPEPELRITFRN